MTVDADTDPLRVAYSAQGTVSDQAFNEIMQAYRTCSVAATTLLTGVQDVVYDKASGQRLDVWGADPDTSRPVVLVIHGGYWRMLAKEDSSFMAGVLAKRGIATVAVDYGLAPTFTMEEMVRQVRASVAWVHTDGPGHGLDPRRITVVGSSAGAHLAAMTLTAGWQQDRGLPAEAVRNGLLLSGLYDLRPLIRTFPNEWLALDEPRAEAASPMLAASTPVPAVVARAEYEASGFMDQTDAFASVRSTQAPTTHRIIAGRNHFDVFLDLGESTSALCADLVALVQQGQTG